MDREELEKKKLGLICLILLCFAMSIISFIHPSGPPDPDSHRFWFRYFMYSIFGGYCISVLGSFLTIMLFREYLKLRKK
jgi:uncharacterized membrane protein